MIAANIDTDYFPCVIELYSLGSYTHFSKCDNCDVLFRTKQGLQNHQSRSTANNTALAIENVE